jgi:hypothetical protein
VPPPRQPGTDGAAGAFFSGAREARRIDEQRFGDTVTLDGLFLQVTDLSRLSTALFSERYAPPYKVRAGRRAGD